MIIANVITPNNYSVKLQITTSDLQITIRQYFITVANLANVAAYKEMIQMINVRAGNL